MADFLHYIKRTIDASTAASDIGIPFAEKQPQDQGFERPIYHSVSKFSGAAGRAGKGDTFWLFSQLRTPWGRLPPSLDARIVIEDFDVVADRVRFRAAESSQWLPLLDASDLIRALRSRNGDGSTPSILSEAAMTVGQAMRFPREAEDVGPLVAHVATLNSTPFDFVSYSMRDGTRCAFNLVRKLLTCGRPVFWDRWSLPRRMSERGERLDHLVLDEYIQKKISESRRVWGVRSPSYAKAGTYSLLEMKLAKSLNKFDEHTGCDGSDA